ncbi:hypothetical protein LUZ61_013448 [Rhynchospora tenuis]|uniref:Uncharacterized protein n=1 Tax=Rhynchospora tenuis TaxID=198213 RepID=A0AAD5W9K7_9POAL|nr:hypothetical protein LUZ61_013448 [Rhynchospora tenuis]
MGNVGADYSKTVAVLNQESASVQMAYAVSAKAAANAPKFPGGEQYIAAHRIQSNNYYLYSHGANVLQALNLNATCYVKNCTFDGAWNGGGGAGLKTIYLSNGFHNTGADIGITNSSNPSTDLRLSEYEKSAKVACGASSFEDARNLFPDVPVFDLPYLCMDLVYVYAVLVDGFGIDPTKLVTAVNSVPHGDSSMRVQWALGLALELISSNHTKMQDITNVFVPSHTLVQIV